MDKEGVSDNELRDKIDNSCEDEENRVVKVSCNLDVEVDSKDKVIYLTPGKLQFFTFNVIKSFGEVHIKSKNKCSGRIIKGNLADYKIFANGILVNTFRNLNYLRSDILIFTAVDEYTKKELEFAVVFGYTEGGIYTCRK